ncbi:MAG: SurA N-terminal domain-containing protein [Gammaproteobacteria bacterium]
MLQSIREHSQGWLAWLIVGLISVPFALWGINSYMDGGSNVTVASVNGKDIGLSQYQNAIQNYTERLQQMFGDKFDVNSLDQNNIKQEVINSLVEQRVIDQVSRKSGMRISNNQLAARIQSLESFQDENGKFSNDLYERRLTQSGASPASFEIQLRGDMLQNQLLKAISDTSFVTKQEENQIGLLQTQKRDIIYTTISADQFRDQAKVSEKEITDYYQKNKENYKTEESVRVNYIDLSTEELAKQIDVDDSILQAYYQSNLQDYTLEERRVAQHIFVALDPDAAPEIVTKATASAKKLLELVKSGIDFDDIPQKHAGLLSSEDEVGKTGAVSKGVMDAEFDEALFGLNVGETSEIVRSKRGLHVIKLVEIQEGKTSTFAESKGDVETKYRQSQAEAKYYEVADELQNLVFENQDSLEVASDTLGLEIRQSEAFTRSKGDDLTSLPNVVEAAFSSSVLEGGNSEPLELSDTRLIVLRAFDHKPAVIKELSAVRDTVKTTILNNKLKDMAQAHGTAVLAKLNEGETPEQLAISESIEWTKNESVSREDPDVKRSILRSVFKLGRPSKGKAVYTGFTDGLNDYTIVGVSAVNNTDIEWTGIDESAGKTIESLKEQRSSSDWLDFIANLKSNADIDIFSESL